MIAVVIIKNSVTYHVLSFLFWDLAEERSM